MIDLAKVPKRILAAVRARGHKESAIAQMSTRELFNEYCIWNGFLNWGDDLWDAATALKALEPPAHEPKVVVWMEGGLVQGVMASTKLELCVIDYDTEGVAEIELTAIPQSNGKVANAYTSMWSAEVDSARVNELVNVAEESALRLLTSETAMAVGMGN